MIIKLPTTLPAKADLAAAAGEIVHGFIGVSRASDPAQVAKFLAIYGLPYADPSGSPYAFCDAGAGYSWAKAFLEKCNVPFTADDIIYTMQQVMGVIDKNYWKLSASCEVTRQDAIARKIYVPKAEVTDHTTIPDNWLAFYNWEGQDVAHHVGVTIKGGQTFLSDVEFNTSGDTTVAGIQQETNGGCVAIKDRNVQFLLGYLQTY